MKHVIRNLSISRKLMLLLLLPVTAALLLALNLIYLNWQQVQMAQQVGRAIETSATMNALVGTLQAERGASGVYLASSGQRFSERVTALRLQTDQRLQAFLSLPQTELADLQQQLNQLTDLRRQVDQFAISNSIAGERYTALISAMIAQNHRLEAGLSQRDMAQQLATLNQFIEMKERAGREPEPVLALQPAGGRHLQVARRDPAPEHRQRLHRRVDPRHR